MLPETIVYPVPLKLGSRPVDVLPRVMVPANTLVELAPADNTVLPPPIVTPTLKVCVLAELLLKPAVFQIVRALPLAELMVYE
jgi:hypothetical protein